MLELFFKTMIIVFGAGYLVALGYEVYDHYWFKFVSKDTKELNKRRVFETRKKTLQKYYEENPHEDPNRMSR